MLKTTNAATKADFPSIKAKNDEQNKEMTGGGRTGRVGEVCSRNKNLSTNTKSKNSDKFKRKSDFAKVNSCGTDFLIFGA